MFMWLVNLNSIFNLFSAHLSFTLQLLFSVSNKVTHRLPTELKMEAKFSNKVPNLKCSQIPRCLHLTPLHDFKIY